MKKRNYLQPLKDELVEYTKEQIKRIFGTLSLDSINSLVRSAIKESSYMLTYGGSVSVIDMTKRNINSYLIQQFRIQQLLK